MRLRRVREESELEPRVGVVLGSGLGGLADELEERVEIPYAEIPGWPVSTAIGHAGTLVLGSLGVVPIAVMRGRAHLYEGIGADRVAFGVRVLGRLGVRTLVVTNAAGGINANYRPGMLVLISDHVNLQGTSSLVGPNDDVARSPFSGHERRVRPGPPSRRARGCGESRDGARRGRIRGVARAAVRDAGGDPVHARRRRRPRRHVDGAGGHRRAAHGHPRSRDLGGDEHGRGRSAPRRSTTRGCSRSEPLRRGH